MHLFVVFVMVAVVGRAIQSLTQSSTRRSAESQVSVTPARQHPYQRQQQELKTMEWFKTGGLKNKP